MKKNYLSTSNEKNKIIIWGLRNKWHTHRFIHASFYSNLKKLGYNVIWVEDEVKNSKLVEKGDLIIAAEVIGKMVKEKITIDDYQLPIIDGVYYCLHNYKDLYKNKINPKYLVNLQFYENLSRESDKKWGPVTFFDSKIQTLYQPWGTNLLYEEFKKPVFNRSKFIFWVGSIWNDHLNRGNIEAVDELKKVLKKVGLKFVHVRFVSETINTFLIRKSRLAPAIAGRHQVKVNYLPCRLFKNISYGQLGITNVKAFKEILGDTFIDGDSMQELIDNALKLSKEEYLTLVKKQQELIKDYTYKNAIENIFRAFDELKKYE